MAGSLRAPFTSLGSEDRLGVRRYYFRTRMMLGICRLFAGLFGVGRFGDAGVAVSFRLSCPFLYVIARVCDQLAARIGAMHSYGSRDVVVSLILLPKRGRREWWSNSRNQEFVSKTQPDDETRCHLPMLNPPPVLHGNWRISMINSTCTLVFICYITRSTERLKLISICQFTSGIRRSPAT